MRNRLLRRCVWSFISFIFIHRFNQLFWRYNRSRYIIAFVALDSRRCSRLRFFLNFTNRFFTDWWTSQLLLLIDWLSYWLLNYRWLFLRLFMYDRLDLYNLFFFSFNYYFFLNSRCIYRDNRLFLFHRWFYFFNRLLLFDYLLFFLNIGFWFLDNNFFVNK